MELQPRRPQRHDRRRRNWASPPSRSPNPSVDSFNDITPRFGVAYDVFGTGKTAVKFSGGRYLGAATNGLAYTRNNPAVPHRQLRVQGLDG